MTLVESDVVVVGAGSVGSRLENALGDVVQDVLAPAPGVLIYGLSSLAAADGDLLAYLARPASNI